MQCTLDQFEGEARRWQCARSSRSAGSQCRDEPPPRCAEHQQPPLPGVEPSARDAAPGQSPRGQCRAEEDWREPQSVSLPLLGPPPHIRRGRAARRRARSSTVGYATRNGSPAGAQRSADATRDGRQIANDRSFEVNCRHHGSILHLAGGVAHPSMRSPEPLHSSQRPRHQRRAKRRQLDALVRRHTNHASTAIQRTATKNPDPVIKGRTRRPRPTV